MLKCTKRRAFLYCWCHNRGFRMAEVPLLRVSYGRNHTKPSKMAPNAGTPIFRKSTSTNALDFGNLFFCSLFIVFSALYLIALQEFRKHDPANILRFGIIQNCPNSNTFFRTVFRKMTLTTDTTQLNQMLHADKEEQKKDCRYLSLQSLRQIKTGCCDFMIATA